jgi:hypothetical protein
MKLLLGALWPAPRHGCRTLAWQRFSISLAGGLHLRAGRPRALVGHGRVSGALEPGNLSVSARPCEVACVLRVVAPGG